MSSYGDKGTRTPNHSLKAGGPGSDVSVSFSKFE